MKKIKILEVNNIDLEGRLFNGYNMIYELDNKKFDIKQAVIIKQSDDKNVIELLNNGSLAEAYERLLTYENVNSIHNVYSITTPNLMNLKEYKEADIIHFHMFHNTKLSLYSLLKISKEKKVILSLHDPWMLTGRCIHFFKCDKWKTGCKSCNNLDSLFSFTKDNCHMMWNLKKQVFDNIDVDLVVPSTWMLDLLKESYLNTKLENAHYIPFGIDREAFAKVKYKKARARYGFKDDERVLFLRAQNDFKGTPYVLEALKKINTKEKIVVLTCDQEHLLDEVADKCKIVDLGHIQMDEMIYAMNACDIFLMPSVGESFGVMAIEAMSCKKPVVVFNNSALPSVTKAPTCGYLVKDRDSNDLMKAIKTLLEDKKECKKRGNLGYKIVKEIYTNEKYIENLEKLYETVYKRPHKKSTLKLENKDPYNIEQLKHQLNELTVMFFGTSSKCAKDLMFNDIKEKRNNKYKIKYDDLYLQEVLYNYCEKLERILENYPILYNVKKLKIEKLLYLLKTNPKMALKKIVKKIII